MSDWADDAPERPPSLGILRQLWPFVRPYRRAFGCCLLILLLSFGLELLGPLLVQQAIDGPLRDDALPPDERIRRLLWLTAGFLLTVGAGAGLGYRYALLTAWNGQRVVRDVRRRLFAHLLDVSVRYHERNAAGKLTTRVTSDVENLSELIATGVLQALFDLLKIAGVLAVLFVIDLRLALFTLASIPVVAALSILFRRNAQKAYRTVRGTLAVQNAYTAELIGGVRATRAFGREAAVQARYAGLNHATAKAWRATVFHFAVFFGLVDLALRGTTIGLLWFGGGSVLDGTMQVGQFVQFWLYYGLLSAPIKELGEKYNVLQAAFASAERILLILAEPTFPPPTPAPAAASPAPGRGPAAIEFRDVRFGYHAGTPVLRGVSFRAAPGATIAVVGPTGAGKTTLLSLVSRLHDVDAGTVLVDDIPVRDWHLPSLRRRVAVVAQDLFLFTGSVLDNVRLFDRRIGEERAWHWLEVVGAADFVRGLPQGIHSPVEERGATFSQGERQLLSFARALCTEPDVLVLDEATASIDSATEARLQQALTVARRGRTALVVAHRLSTVRHADVILVLERGQVVEAGTHADLVARNGHYAAMLRAIGAEA